MHMYFIEGDIGAGLYDRMADGPIVTVCMLGTQRSLQLLNPRSHLPPQF